MYNRNTVKVRISDVSYYLRNTKYYFRKGYTGCSIIYLSSLKSCIKDAIMSFKKF